MTHESFMQRCVELAAMAREQGNTPVGSVVVLDGAIIGEGIETAASAGRLMGLPAWAALKRRQSRQGPPA